MIVERIVRPFWFMDVRAGSGMAASPTSPTRGSRLEGAGHQSTMTGWEAFLAETRLPGKKSAIDRAWTR